MGLNDDALISIRKAIEVGSREDCRNLFENLIIILSALGRIEEEIEIKSITIESFKNNYLRIGLVQIDYEMTEEILPRLKNKEFIKIKILKALKLAQEIQVDIICFPELCFSESFIGDVKPYEQMIIIGGSYYDNNNFNVCPIFIQGNPFCHKFSIVGKRM